MEKKILEFVKISRFVNVKLVEGDVLSFRFCRTGKYAKTYTISEDVFRAMKPLLEKIKEDLENRVERKRLIYDGNYISTSEYEGQMYFGFVKRENRMFSWKKALNLPGAIFGEFEKAYETLDYLLSQNKMKNKKRKFEYYEVIESSDEDDNNDDDDDARGKITVKKYSWSYINEEGKTVMESPCYYFAEARCRIESDKGLKEATIKNKNDSRLRLEIGCFTVPSDYAEWVKGCYKFGMNRLIRHIMLKRCVGCSEDQPGQMSHTEGGCLSRWEEAIEMYKEEARRLLGEETLIMWCYKVFECLGFPLDKVKGVVEDLSFWKPAEESLTEDSIEIPEPLEWLYMDCVPYTMKDFV